MLLVVKQLCSINVEVKRLCGNFGCPVWSQKAEDKADDERAENMNAGPFDTKDG